MRKHLLALLASAALTIGDTGQVMAHEFDEDHDEEHEQLQGEHHQDHHALEYQHDNDGSDT